MKTTANRELLKASSPREILAFSTLECVQSAAAWAKHLGAKLSSRFNARPEAPSQARPRTAQANQWTGVR